MCEIRFNISGKDGKLEGMLKAIPSAIRTEVTKEALRYFLTHVRDNKVESNYIDSSDLASFKVDIEKSSFNIDDMMKVLTSYHITPVQYPENIKVQYNNNQDIIKNNINNKEEDDYILDLSEKKFDNNSGSISIESLNIDEINFEDMNS